MKTSNDLRRENLCSVLFSIQQGGPISKNKIAAMTGLSQVTVHKVVNELVDRGICAESGARVSTGGRNAALFQINGRCGAILGQTLYRQHIMTVAYDLSLQPLYTAESPNNLSDVQESIRNMTGELRRAQETLKGWRFLGIGVSLPGRSNADGVVIQVPGFVGWNHMPLKEMLEQEFQLPVSVDNDNNALAISTKYNGQSSRFTDYVYLDVSEGIGMGVVIDNHLFRGKNGYGCEIGHTCIMLNGPLCSCGSHGCLEAFLSHAHLLNCISAKCEAAGDPAPQSIAEAIEQARKNPDSAAAGVFRDASQYISVAIEHIYRIFDTQAVFLHCTWLAACPGLFQQVVNKVFSDLPWVRRDRFSILYEEDRSITESAAPCLFLDRVYMGDALESTPSVQEG